MVEHKQGQLGLGQTSPPGEQQLQRQASAGELLTQTGQGQHTMTGVPQRVVLQRWWCGAQQPIKPGLPAPGLHLQVRAGGRCQNG